MHDVMLSLWQKLLCLDYLDEQKMIYVSLPRSKDTMETLLASIGTCLGKQGDKHVTFLVDWGLLKPIVKKWSRNRDPDMQRVQEIGQYMSHGGYVPVILHLADVQDEGIVCYDGNHRREALNLLEKPPHVIIDMLCNASQKDVYDAFDMLNKSVQVPAIYFEQEDLSYQIKDQLIQLVKSYETKYKSHLSPSPRCHAPQFNRDQLVDQLHRIITLFQGRVSVASLKDALEVLNALYKQGRLCKPHHTYKEKVIAKCRDSGLWLFIDRDISVEHLKIVLCEQ